MNFKVRFDSIKIGETTLSNCNAVTFNSNHKSVLCIFMVTTVSCSRLTERIYFPETKKTDHIPFSFGIGNTSIFVNPTVKGKKYRFFFDTGASGTLISEDVPSIWLGVSDSAKAPLLRTSFYHKLHTIPSLMLGETRFNDFTYHNLLPELVDPFPHLGKIDGILGGNIFKNFVWKIDFAARQISFSIQPDSSYLATKGMAFTVKNNIPYITALVNNVPIEFVLDFGYTSFSHINTMHLEKVRQNQKTILTQFKYHLNRKPANVNLPAETDTTFIVIGKLQIGDQILYDELFDLSKSDVNVLGIDFFKRYSEVVLDYPNQMLYLGEPQHKSFAYLELVSRMINTMGMVVSDDTVPVVIGLSPWVKDLGVQLSDTIATLNHISTLNNPASFYKDTVLSGYDSIRNTNWQRAEQSRFDQLKNDLLYLKDTLVIGVKRGNNIDSITLTRRYHFTHLPDTVQDYDLGVFMAPIYTAGYRINVNSGTYYIFKTKRNHF